MYNIFRINIKILKISGLWISKRNEKTIRIIYNSILVFYAMIFFTIAEFVTLKESSKDINDLVKNLNMSMSFLLTLYKVFVWFYNRNTILEIMETLDKTVVDFKNVERIVLKEKRVVDKLAYTFFVIAFTVPTSACLLTFFEVFFRSPGEDSVDGFQKKLPYYSYVPFDYHSSKLAYCFAVVYQCMALLICGTMTVGLDILFTGLVSFTSVHFEILQESFKSIKANCIENIFPDYTEDELNKAMEKELARCIQHLQLILKICETLENIYTYLILMQMLISLLVFCTCLYLVSTIPIGSQVIGNELAYMMAIENQLALYCYAGNKLTLAGEGIPFSVYDCDWLGTTKKFKSNMIITMMRMSKPIHITAGKFTNLTLETFVTIGRGSYSLLAVLKR